MKKGVCVHQGADGSQCKLKGHLGHCKGPAECPDYEDSLEDLPAAPEGE